ncbi:hypothetical protein PPTG_23350 [Phytophthora nicotianae INRA-310]|uniref:Uncharacterized protein n=1 Tax=Phytophthora nicotianae (strain INRA-310) TaxID=761204 RepID=W2Q197_PHYN3|nr:hypothetical protein PPTG_23350 [Phytophthora nicotianae INRA-310]ETN06289.1 hypothetical protein PPTG_23350 [Phytophthora nicotianae INRA-310]
MVESADALLGQLVRGLIRVVTVIAPTLSTSITWDYNDEEVGPIVPVSTWSIQSNYPISLKQFFR